jgi:hypothetical protein
MLMARQSNLLPHVASITIQMWRRLAGVVHEEVSLSPCLGPAAHYAEAAADRDCTQLDCLRVDDAQCVLLQKYTTSCTEAQASLDLQRARLQQSMRAWPARLLAVMTAPALQQNRRTNRTQASLSDFQSQRASTQCGQHTVGRMVRVCSCVAL